jgi:hypothetical protein
VFLLAGPVLYQGLRVRVPPVFQRWQMFAGKGIEICQVSYSIVEKDGTSRTLDRYEALGISHDSPKARRIHRISRKRIGWAAKRACLTARRGGDREPDVRLRARCGSRGRWVLVEDGSRNVCAPQP